MTIHNANAYVRNLWDWAVLDGCFGTTKIKPTDIDGSVERNHHFLFIETKETGVLLDAGQFIYYRRLVKKPDITAFIVWGDPGKPTHIQIFARNGISKRYPCDLETLRRYVARWFALAEKHRPVVIRKEDIEGEL